MAGEPWEPHQSRGDATSPTWSATCTTTTSTACLLPVLYTVADVQTDAFLPIIPAAYTAAAARTTPNSTGLARDASATSQVAASNINMSATSPYRANIAAQQSLPQTPSRRALGDLTQRALNSPATHSAHKDPSEATRPRSPLKKASSHIPNVFADKENLDTVAATPQGKKRGIEEVDDVEKAGGAKMLAHARDESLWDSGMRLTTAAVQRHTVRHLPTYAPISY
jgi:hypothetical protein